MNPTDILSHPPVRRLGCQVIAFNPAGEVLVVDPEYKSGLTLPGGSALQGEAPNEAAARHLALETGLVLDLWQILAVDYVPEGVYPEGINLVFNGGMLTDRQVERIAVPPIAKSRLHGFRFVPMTEVSTCTEPYQRRRIRQAYNALNMAKALPLLLRGELVC
ncbi:NUDIX domain-containing protein [Kitasatospora sp. NBC_01266]|uniref:NUDIX domain-containing protein n=1 Tax=Kitasatospora sp. NBC_01266 TaxID=2903572 RepID=UPI002E3064B5|nr:NUDIX domain-containing protein [Kitasatospora sp. NBC_01266]